MSAEIKMPAIATPPIVIKVGGKCYSLQQEAVPGKPNNSLSNIQWAGLTCAACAAAGDVPTACPCETAVYPCGATGSELVTSYTISINNILFPDGFGEPVALGAKTWDGVVAEHDPYYGGGPCVWNRSLNNYPTATKYPTTSTISAYMVGLYSSLGYVGVQLGLVSGVAWYVWARSGGAHGVWTKNEGATPVGRYTMIDSGTSFAGVTSSTIRPTSITVAETA